MSGVTIVAGNTPGTYRVMLSDGSHFSVAPVGLVFRHQNMVQRRDQVRAQLGQDPLLDIDGTLYVSFDGNTRRYRLNAQLRWSNILDNPGFIEEGSRLWLRYRDGWEQEIVALD